MDKKTVSRSSGARWSPDIVELETGRRFKPLGQTNKSEPMTLGIHRFSSKSILPLARKRPLKGKDAKVTKESRKTPPANFNEYTYRRSRRIYNKALNENPVKLPSLKTEDDPMMRLRGFANFRLNERDVRSKDIFMACLGLQRKEGINYFSLLRDDFNCKSRHMSDNEPVRQGFEEITLEELLSEGYMVYPHDLLGTSNDANVSLGGRDENL